MDLNTYLQSFLTGFYYLFFNPFLYLFGLIIYFHYKRLVSIERRLFHVKIYSAWEHTWQSIVNGIWGGLIASSLVLGIGIVLSPTDFWLLLVVAFFLSLLHVKYLCFAYAGGIVGIISFIAKINPQITDHYWGQWIWSSFSQVHIPSMLAFVAVLHLVEGVLTRQYAAHGASPLFIQNKRGRIIGGYQMQKLWLMPVVTVVSGDSGGFVADGILSWWPLLAEQHGAALMFLPIPVVIGYGDTTVSEVPQKKALFSFKILSAYSLILLGLSVGSFYFPPLVLMAALFAFIGHEMMIWYSNRRDWQRPPLFVQEKQGVRVLAVIPGSPAEDMGVEPGDRVIKVNGVNVNHKDQLYPAIQKHPAFCKMEVMNTEENIKFLQRSLYAGEHHQLGIIVAPDHDARYYVEMNRPAMWGFLRKPVDQTPLEMDSDKHINERLNKINS